MSSDITFFDKINQDRPIMIVIPQRSHRIACIDCMAGKCSECDHPDCECPCHDVGATPPECPHGKSKSEDCPTCDEPWQLKHTASS